MVCVRCVGEVEVKRAQTGKPGWGKSNAIAGSLPPLVSRNSNASPMCVVSFSLYSLSLLPFWYFFLFSLFFCCCLVIPSRSLGARRRLPLGLALLVQQVAVPRRGPGELGAAVGAGRLGRLARLLPLVPEEVAEGGELPAVAPVLPALGLGPALDDADDAALAVVVVVVRRPAALHHRGHGVGHHCWVVGDGSSVQISKTEFFPDWVLLSFSFTYP